MSYELDNAVFEAARNEAIDAYFDARPQIFRTREKELYVEAGFRMAFEFLKSQKPVGWISDSGLYHSETGAKDFCTKRDSVKPLYVLPASV